MNNGKSSDLACTKKVHDKVLVYGEPPPAPCLPIVFTNLKIARHQTRVTSLDL